jgi:hypothetical protein
MFLVVFSSLSHGKWLTSTLNLVTTVLPSSLTFSKSPFIEHRTIPRRSDGFIERATSKWERILSSERLWTQIPCSCRIVGSRRPDELTQVAQKKQSWDMVTPQNIWQSFWLGCQIPRRPWCCYSLHVCVRRTVFLVHVISRRLVDCKALPGDRDKASVESPSCALLMPLDSHIVPSIHWMQKWNSCMEIDFQPLLSGPP